MLSPWPSATTIPNTSYGKELTIIADVNNVLYFRVFDPAGMQIMDTDETKLPAKAADIAALQGLYLGLTTSAAFAAARFLPHP